MKVGFDTSVLVTALVDQLPHHEAAFGCLAAACGSGEEAVVSTHALAECYATLTALPLRRRISPGEARLLISEGLENRLNVVTLDQGLYVRAMDRVALRGLASGVIYDALHLLCAESAGCARIYTFNLTHFLRLDPQGIQVMSP